MWKKTGDNEHHTHFKCWNQNHARFAPSCIVYDFACCLSMRNGRERNIYFIFTFYYYHHQCNFLSSPAICLVACVCFFSSLSCWTFLTVKRGCEKDSPTVIIISVITISIGKGSHEYVTLWNTILRCYQPPGCLHWIHWIHWLCVSEGEI